MHRKAVVANTIRVYKYCRFSVLCAFYKHKRDQFGMNLRWTVFSDLCRLLCSVKSCSVQMPRKTSTSIWHRSPSHATSKRARTHPGRSLYSSSCPWMCTFRVQSCLRRRKESSQIINSHCCYHAHECHAGLQTWDSKCYPYNPTEYMHHLCFFTWRARRLDSSTGTWISMHLIHNPLEIARKLSPSDEQIAFRRLNESQPFALPVARLVEVLRTESISIRLVYELQFLRYSNPFIQPPLLLPLKDNWSIEIF